MGLMVFVLFGISAVYPAKYVTLILQKAALDNINLLVYNGILVARTFLFASASNGLSCKECRNPENRSNSPGLSCFKGCFSASAQLGCLVPALP